MKILIDSHVHVYPGYDFARMLAAFAGRVRAHGAEQGVMMLAQRTGMAMPETPNAPGSSASGIGAPGAGAVALAPGRQIACAERIEILALGVDAQYKDGIPARDAVRRAIDAGAAPVLAWGAGKWLFGRARAVEALLSEFGPAELAIGDSSMRPVFWPEPRLMRQARMAGYILCHGSDPLPPKSEETRAGQFCDIADAEDFDPAAPAGPQALRILRTARLRAVGRRAGVLEFAKRMLG